MHQQGARRHSARAQVGRFPIDTARVGAGFKQGVVSTGNSLDYTAECMTIMGEQKAAIKEMEAAAVAYVCRVCSTPMFAVKAVTDIVDGERPAHEEFLENLGKAAGALQDAVSRIVEYLDGKTLTEL